MDPKSTAVGQECTPCNPGEKGAGSSKEQGAHVPTRMCVSCRIDKPRPELLRLTVDSKSGELKLNLADRRIYGRSAYVCKSKNCWQTLMKGGRLRGALEGRKRKGLADRRTIKWPLEPQLIQQITEQCTEP